MALTISFDDAEKLAENRGAEAREKPPSESS